MKFESKFGIDEIVAHVVRRRGKIIFDSLLKVVVVHFEKDKVVYTCRTSQNLLVHFNERELVGDPDFNQELGCYPPEALTEDELGEPELLEGSPWN